MIDPKYRRTVLIQLVVNTTIELFSAIVFLLFFPVPPITYIWYTLIALWIALFVFIYWRKLVNPRTRAEYIAKWESEGRPTSYGAV